MHGSQQDVAQFAVDMFVVPLKVADVSSLPFKVPLNSLEGLLPVEKQVSIVKHLLVETQIKLGILHHSLLNLLDVQHVDAVGPCKLDDELHFCCGFNDKALVGVSKIRTELLHSRIVQLLHLVYVYVKHMLQQRCVTDKVEY